MVEDQQSSVDDTEEGNDNNGNWMVGGRWLTGPKQWTGWTDRICRIKVGGRPVCN